MSRAWLLPFPPQSSKMTRIVLFLLTASLMLPFSTPDKFFDPDDDLTYIRGPSNKGQPTMKDVSSRKVASRNSDDSDDEQGSKATSGEKEGKNALQSSDRRHRAAPLLPSDTQQGVDVSVKTG